MKSSKSVSRKNFYCSNCGKYGHNMKKCEEPITSLGIISIKFDNMLIHNNNFKKFLASKYLEIDNYNFSEDHLIYTAIDYSLLLEGRISHRLFILNNNWATIWIVIVLTTS